VNKCGGYDWASMLQLFRNLLCPGRQPVWHWDVSDAVLTTKFYLFQVYASAMTYITTSLGNPTSTANQSAPHPNARSSRPNGPIRQCHIPTSRDIAILHWQIIVRVSWSYFILFRCSSTQPQGRYRLRLCFNLISCCTAPAQTFPFLGHRNTAVQLGLCGTLLFFKLMCPPQSS
jgi:hypothetical protein